MSLLIWALLGLLSLALVLGAALLCLPVRLVLAAASEPARLRIGLGILGGLVPVIPLFDSARPGVVHRRAGAGWEAAGDGERRIVMLRAGLRLLREVLAVVRLEGWRGHLRFGLGDPAETGQLYGYLVPVSLMMREGLDLVPDFERACFIGHCDGAIRVVPLRLVVPLVRFARAVGRAS